MSTRSIVFAVAVLAGGLFSSGASAVEGTTTADALLRVGPGDDFAEIGTIEAGSALKIHSCHTAQGWCLVRISGRSGWVPSALVKAGDFFKTTSYFDPYARASVGFYAYDYGFYGDGVSGAQRFQTPLTGRFQRSRLSDKQLSRDFRYIDRRHLSDKRLPRDFRFDRGRLSNKHLPRGFRSTIDTPGFRLRKQGFPRFTGD